jgi:hypothetical protein
MSSPYSNQGLKLNEYFDKIENVKPPSASTLKKQSTLKQNEIAFKK